MSLKTVFALTATLCVAPIHNRILPAVIGGDPLPDEQINY